MRLTPTQQQTLQTSVLNDFADENELAQMVQFGLGQRLDLIRSNPQDHRLSAATFDLLNWANQNDRAEDLVAAMQAAKPRDAALQELAQELKGGTPPPPPPNKATPPLPGRLLTGKERNQLIDLLLKLPNSGDLNARNLLLANLPDEVRGSIPVSYAAQPHISNIVDALNNTQLAPLPDGTLPLLVILDDALYAARGMRFASDLQALYNTVAARQGSS